MPKTHVFSDSVLCLGGISHQPVEAWKNNIKGVPGLGGISDEPVKAWNSRITWFLETRYLKDLKRIDGASGKKSRIHFNWVFPKRSKR